MRELDVEIVNKLGLHARAAAKFVSLAATFDSEIGLQKGDRRVNGKSIMGVMMLAASQGTSIRLIADGPDEDEALRQLADLIADCFGEGG